MKYTIRITNKYYPLQSYCENKYDNIEDAENALKSYKNTAELTHSIEEL